MSRSSYAESVRNQRITQRLNETRDGNRKARAVSRKSTAEDAAEVKRLMSEMKKETAATSSVKESADDGKEWAEKGQRETEKYREYSDKEMEKTRAGRDAYAKKLAETAVKNRAEVESAVKSGNVSKAMDVLVRGTANSTAHFPTPTEIPGMYAKLKIADSAARTSSSNSAAQVKANSTGEWQTYLENREKKKTQLTRMRDALSIEQGKVYDQLKNLEKQPETDETKARKKTLSEMQKRIRAACDELTKRIEDSELETYNLEQLGRHYAVMDEPDFEKYAKKGRVNDKKGIFGSYNKVEYLLSDDKLAQMGYVSGQGASDPDFDRARVLTDSERNIYNYYYAKEGAKKANQFLKDIEPVLNERVAEKNAEKTAAQSKKHPYLIGYPTAVAGQVASSAAALGLAAQSAFNGDKPVDPNSPWTAPVRTAQAAIEGATSDVGPVGQFLYQIGVSAGSSAINAPLGKAGLVNMALGATGSSMYDAAQKTDNKARMVWAGVLNGAAEYAGEKLGGIGPLEGRIADIGEALARNGSTANVVKYIAAHVGEEAAEEVGTEIMNKAVDMLVMGDEGDLRTYYNQQLAAGNDAFKLTAAMALKDIALAGLGGGMNGGALVIMPSVGMKVRSAANNARSANNAVDSLSTYKEKSAAAVTGNTGGNVLSPVDAQDAVNAFNGGISQPESVAKGKISGQASEAAPTEESEGLDRGTSGGQDKASYVQRIKSLSRVFNDEMANAILDDFTEEELRQTVSTDSNELRRQAAEIALEYKERQTGGDEKASIKSDNSINQIHTVDGIAQPQTQEARIQYRNGASNTRAVPSVSSFKTNNTGRNQPSVSGISVPQNQAAVNPQSENSSPVEQSEASPNPLTKEGQTGGTEKASINQIHAVAGIALTNKASHRQHNDVSNNTVSQNGPAVNSRNENSETKFNLKKDITQSDVQAIQFIGRKSINDFDEADRSKTEAVAQKYYREIGTKSPFFRSWFGDWRANDTKKVSVTHISDIAGFDAAKDTVRGEFANKDTGWEKIRVGRKGINDTVSHSSGKRISAKTLSEIKELIENAVLLDSETSIPERANKHPNTLFMHKLYAPAVFDGRDYIAKISVEEYADNSDTSLRFYNLRSIEISPTGAEFSSKSIPTGLPNIGDNYTVSQFFNLVKTYDKDFKPKDSSKVVNPDGTPKVVYHGTNAEFNVFDTKRHGQNYWQSKPSYKGGFFFTSDRQSAQNYAELAGGDRVVEGYLNIKNPLEINAPSALRPADYYDIHADDIMRQADRDGHDGVIIKGKRDNLYIVFNPNQIKSATDNTGAFDPGNGDIRYSLRKSARKDMFRADEAAEKKYGEQIDGWLRGKMPSNGVFELGKTPGIFQKLGAKNLPVIMPQEVISKITGGKHDISLDEIKKLPSVLADPLMIFNSATVPGAFVTLTELTDKAGNSVVVALHLNRVKDHFNVNRISSVYGKSNVVGFINRQIEDGNLRYIDKEKSEIWSQDRGLQLPKSADTITRSNSSILQKSDFVNTQTENSSPDGQTNISPNLLTKEQRSAVNRLSRACGVKVEIVPTLPMNNGRGANGKYVKGERAIYLAEDAERPMFDIFSHELTHYLRVASPEAFSNYSKAAMEVLVEENAVEGESANETRARLVRQVREAYASAGQDLGYTDAMEELAADFTGRLMDSPEEVFRMINEAQSLNEQQKRGVIQRIIDAIDRFVKRIKAYINNTGDNVAPEELNQLGRTRQALVELLAASEESGNTNGENGPAADDATANGYGGKTNENGAQNEKNTLIEKINSAENVLADMDIVDTLTGAEFPKSEKGLVDQVTEFYSDAYNGKVTNPEIGEILLDRRGVKNSLAHGIGRTKAIAFAAVPTVIENGKIIEKTSNWKGRNIDTYIIAAPIEINDKRVDVGVIVSENSSTKRFYLHEVAIKNDVPIKTGDKNSNSAPSDTSLSDNNIPQNGPAVNPQNENSGDVRYSVKSDMAKEGYDPEKISVDDMWNWLFDKYGKAERGEINGQNNSAAKHHINTKNENPRKNKLSRRAPETNASPWNQVERNSSSPKEKKDKPLTLGQILDQINITAGVPIGKGKITNPRAEGVYKVRDEVIRTRLENDLPIISHELGHWIDSVAGLSNARHIEEAIAAMDPDFRELYSNEEIPGEAVAEFVKLYLKTKDIAQKKVPGFYEEFREKLRQAGELERIDSMAEDINRYFSQSAEERLNNVIVSSDDKKRAGFGETAKGIRQKLVADYIDGFARIDEFQRKFGLDLHGEKDAYVMAINSLNSRSKAAYVLANNFVDLDGNVVGKSFIDCFEGMDKKSIAKDMSNVFNRGGKGETRRPFASRTLIDLDNYLTWRHALEWIEGKDGSYKQVFADPTMENPKLLKAKIADMERIHPMFSKTAKNLYEYQTNLLTHYGIQSGMLTQRAVDRMKELYPDYVPFFRVSYDALNGGTPARGRGTLANQGPAVMRAKGSGFDIKSPLESIINNTTRLVDAAMKNQAMLAMADIAEETQGFGGVMERIPPDMARQTIPLTAQRRNLERRFDHAVNERGETVFNTESLEAINNILDEELGDVAVGYSPKLNQSKDIAYVWRDGHKDYYKVRDEALLKSIGEFSPKQLQPIFRLSNRLMTVPKMLMTSLNPLFGGNNLLRDFGTAYYNSDDTMFSMFIWHYLAAAKHVIAHDEVYQQWRAMGGGNNTNVKASRDAIVDALKHAGEGKSERIIKGILPWRLMDTMMNLNEGIESIPRVMAFDSAIRKGKGVQQAAYEAADITVNFKRSGVMSKELNSIFMFNNAAIQGLYKVYRSLFKEKPREALLRLGKYLIFALAMTALENWISNKADPDRKDRKRLSPYTKNSYYCFAKGDGKFAKIAKPREQGLLTSFTERCVDLIFGDENAFEDFGEYVAANVLPPILPVDSIAEAVTKGDIAAPFHAYLGETVFGGFADLAFNRDFKGTPIESEYLEQQPARDRVRSDTSAIAVWLGDKLNMSPMRIDHLINSYGGIIGTVNKSIFPADTDKTAGQRIATLAQSRVVADSVYSNNVLNRVYNGRDKARLDFAEQETGENMIAKNKYELWGEFISQYNKAASTQNKYDNRAARAKLLDVIDAIQEEKYFEMSGNDEELARVFDSSNLDRDKKDGITLSSFPKSKLERTKKGKKYTYQLSPEEYAQMCMEIEVEVGGAIDAIIKSGRYSLMDDDERAELLSKAVSEGKSDIKQKYIRKHLEDME